MKYALVHRTTYKYAEPAEACHNLARLTPRDMPGQSCLQMELSVEPAPAEIDSYTDYFGNRVHSFAISGPHQQLSITARSVLVRESLVTPELPRSQPWEQVAAGVHDDRSPPAIDALQFVYDSVFVRGHRRLREFAQATFPRGRDLLEATFELTKRIHGEFTYDAAATKIDTPVHDVLERRRGVCQDFAHLQIGCLRSLGLPCRYMSGYLRTTPGPGRPRLQGADASHAWISVWSPEQGWVDFDPTNGCRVGDGHITIGWGRDYHDVSPVKGVVLGGSGATLQVAVDVVPIEEEAAAARPEHLARRSTA